MAPTWKKISFAADVIANTLLSAQSVCVAIDSGVPTKITLDASHVLARIAGDIVAADKADLLAMLGLEDGADVTDAGNVETAGAIMESIFQKVGDLIVGHDNGEVVLLQTAALEADAGRYLKVGPLDVLEWAPVTAGAGDFMADGSVPMTGHLHFAGKQAIDMIIQNVANKAAVDGYAAPHVGKPLFAVTGTAVYFCTVSA